MSELIQQIVQVLKEQVVQDTVVPRNIRRAAEQAIEVLLDESRDPAVRAADAIAILEEISEDPNMPMHTRTIIWEVLGALEQVK
ncbi:MULTISPECIES: UPF0147 family protein [Thermococcus]|jgi:uncharacterized protein (UPF0147 family)|uniref:UPF0147 protein TK2131 n=2 Tax=Thermococcus TaxID=2263 RepID=Y2131_THEKO|nr:MULTISPECIES: UPF0147 family protein [Thermococcus]Q5JHG1.1 RecName: Full=UPF0147 protein TK2131 [Thermococcus kodakarensis KOD1]AMQ18546.1 hypothetical protein A0127_04880 [Thermococcus peptonophilus]MBP1911294.1 uncharacterized protein (UPF0147 family) [Thermococcus stetteri]WCN27978.1 UPF0147 family protein [Thermococcus kodakarensis]WCN30277.1 UPF0147 family protein [Thermococcus kodakarensis]BAD86320.1 hypothetical protein, conserved, UPF0147 family [Thermococcus kodakarensis KOD1]